MTWKGVLVVCLAVGCSRFPADPEHTADRVEHGTLRVGVVSCAPWIRGDTGEPQGIEADLVRDLAREMGAKIAWTHGGESALLPALERFDLDLVVGGLTKDTPWKSRIGLTEPYLADHVLAVPPGENRWLLRVEGFVLPRRGALRERFLHETIAGSS